jgi:hypothetical protein
MPGHLGVNIEKLTFSGDLFCSWVKAVVCRLYDALPPETTASPPQKVMEAKKDDLREFDDAVARLRENQAREAYAAVRQNNRRVRAES